ncbi:MAG: SAM-dependent methyltransferase, partial [Lachnospiraceae bacterium]|nr:SAM-dependent methyltransferase [Lachnospiraceae bacterium]
ALTLSGLSTRRFCFEGFLPAEKKDRTVILEELKKESRTIVIYEAPHRLKRTLDELYEVLGERRVTLCRELTKVFETVIPTTLREAVTLYETEEPRGEFVLVIEGRSLEEKRREEIADWERMSVEEHMEFYESQGMDSKSAMKQVAKDRGVGKREIYSYLNKERAD